MFAVVVDIVVKEGFAESFLLEAMLQAKNSRTLEPECLVFDVLRSQEDPCRFTLYEVYTSKANFYEVHRATPHFKAYAAATKPWVVSKAIHELTRAWPD